MTNPQNSRRQEVLDALPCSHVDLIEKNGMHRNLASRWLKRLHDEGECHIIDWNRSPGGGPFFPTYAKGPGEDAPCTLEPIPVRENWHRHMQRKRERQREEAERWLREEGARWLRVVEQFSTTQKLKRRSRSNRNPPFKDE